MSFFKNPKPGMEKDTAEYIEPLLTESDKSRIIKDNLTLKGCIEYCFKQGKKFEIKCGNTGFAPITQEQHLKWCCKYFGINYAGLPGEHKQAANGAVNEDKKANALNLDIDGLFDF